MEYINKSKFKKSHLLSIALVVVCVFVFLFLVIKYKVAGVFQIDVKAINFSQSIQNPILTNVFKILTHCGSILTILIITILLICICKPLEQKIMLVANVGAVSLFCWIVKHIIVRPRPENINLIQEVGYSFPSAHALISVVFYGFVIFLLWNSLKNLRLKITLTLFLSIFSLLIGYTRVYLGVHYLTDVIAGILAGVAYLIVAVNVYYLVKKIIHKRRKHE